LIRKTADHNIILTLNHDPASMLKKNLLITFDYELFLGKRSGLASDCVLDPTNKIIEVLSRHNATGIFFIDTLYLLRLQELASVHDMCAKDLDAITQQIIQLVNEGHSVFPHLHPHWLDAVYDQGLNQWNLEKINRYRFHKVNEQDRKRVFDDSVAILSEIIQKADKSTTIDGFRAGGWCIQPFSDFKPSFRENRIRFEFSVLSGFYQFTDAQYFDFSNSPVKPIYRFEDDITREDKNGSFFQFTISSMKVAENWNLLNRMWVKLHSALTGDHTYNKGSGQRSMPVGNGNPENREGKDLADKNYERLAIENMTLVKKALYSEFLRNHDYMHLISHPKMITNHNLKVFDKFLKNAFEKYIVETNFRNMILD